MKRILFALFSFFIVLLPLNAQQKVDESSVRKQINDAVQRMRTMQCDFVQTKTMRLLGDKMVSKGKMYYSTGNKLRWEYTTPYQYVFVMNQNKVLLKKGGKSQVIDVNQSKIFKEITRIMMNSVLGNCLSDMQDFKSTLQQTQQEWIATMVPQKKNLKQMFQTIKVHFSRQRSIVTQVEMIEKNGDRTIIELRNMQTNHKLNATLFNIQ